MVIGTGVAALVMLATGVRMWQDIYGFAPAGWLIVKCVCWLGLSAQGYGIHGTPSPEQVGRTESHGCFRLANWNAEYLIKLAWVGMPVYVEP